MVRYIFDSSMGTMTTLAFITAYLVVICFSLSMHEFAHAFTAYKFGDVTPKAQGRLTLNPMRHIDPIGIICLLIFGFGWAKPVQINPLSFRNYKVGMSVVSLAGIVTNFILAFIFSGLLFFLSFLANSTNLFLVFIYDFLLLGVIINISLAIFNLLPIYPLDGFKFMSTFLSYNNKFVQFMFRYGNIVLIFFILTPIFDIIFSFATVGILQGFFGFWGLFA